MIFNNLYNDDGIMAMAMRLFFEGKKKNDIRIIATDSDKLSKEGRQVFNQMKEQAEDVEYEEI